MKSRFDKSNGEDNQAKITWLRKAREIRSGFSKGDASYFLKITSICFDNLNDNLYVADSELHRIFKFNNNGDYITSFGSEGQGPGELLGIIRISVGNDGILYATDDANMRIIAFSKEGEFIRQIPAFGIPGDIALVNSKGEIYLLSPSGLRIIDFFDSNMKLLRSLLDMSYYLDFPFDRPPQKRLNRMILGPSIHDVKKLLTQDDELILIFSNTLTVISFDKKNSIINRFRVGHPIFLKDYKKRLKRIISAGGWLNSFGSVFVDNNSHLCFCYYNESVALPEIYRYRKDGAFVDTLRAEDARDRTNSLISVCDSKGNFYSISLDGDAIIIYRLAD